MLMNYSRRSGFTLVEVIVAMTVLAIIMTSLLFSFRTGIKAFDMGTKHGEQQQIGRYAVGQVSKDLRTIFYKPESDYNVARRQVEALSDQNQETIGGERESLSDRDDDLDIDENLPDMGPAIDLSFKGEDGGDVDRISFVSRLGYKEGQEQVRWNLARIDYYVEEGNLYRAIDDIMSPEVDENGYEIPKPYPPKVDKLASNCVGFDIKYGYFYDGSYLLADSWDSSAAQYRNPEDEEYDDGIIDPLKDPDKAGVVSTGAAAAAISNNQLQDQMQRQDNLPGWVELTFRFAPDMKFPERYRTYKQTVLMYNKGAVETFVPTDEEDELRGNHGRRNRDSSDRTERSGRER